MKRKNNPIEESKSHSDSNSVSRSSGSEVVRLFKNEESSKLDDDKDSLNEEEKHRSRHKKHKVYHKEDNLFPSFESDEIDENVPKLWNNDNDPSVSDDSIEDIINIKIFTYRRNLLGK